MKAAPPGGMEGGEMIMGPGKVRGLPMGAACSTGWAWKTKMHDIIVIELKTNYDAVKVKMEWHQQHPVSLVLTVSSTCTQFEEKNEESFRLKKRHQY